MVKFLKMLVAVIVLPLLFVFTACSDGGGGSSNNSDIIETTTPSGGGGSNNNSDIIETTTPSESQNEVKKSVKESNFGLILKSSDGSSSALKTYNYTLSIIREGRDLTKTMSDYIATSRNTDGSITIVLKSEGSTLNDIENRGIESLQLDDLITLNVEGYTSQQFKITKEMLEKSAAEVALKAVSSRQTYSLKELLSDSDAVQPRTTFGATVSENDDTVTFTTNDKSTSLTLSKASFKRVARQISRLPRANTNTEVFLDMTPIDPVSEHESTIGDFTFDPDVEPKAERQARATRANTSEDNGLESVMMADLKMTTSDGDEIHCFNGGNYDEESATCDDGGEASLKMLIPVTQFELYAQKYNAGDRVVPLYSYNSAKALWVRQLDANGNGKDGELILEDNDANAKANSGDNLYIEGKVTHFSWWNGDYPYKNACLNVTVNKVNSAAVSYVRIKGVDYTGREPHYSLISNNDTETVENMNAKAESIVEIALIMNSGEIGDSIVYTTAASNSQTECEDVGTLNAPSLNDINFTVSVKDSDGNNLENVSLRFNNSYKTTDASGNGVFNLAIKDHLVGKLTATYNENDFTVVEEVDLNQSETTYSITLDTRKVTLSGQVKESLNGSAPKEAADAIVEIYSNEWSYYQYVRTLADGTFTINLPFSKIEANPDATIQIYTYNSEYAYYPSISKQLTLNKDSSDLGEFLLSFSVSKVSGRVTNSENTPINSAYINSNAMYRYTYSDNQGYYNITFIGESSLDINDTLNAYDFVSSKSDAQDITLRSGTKSTVNFEIDQRKATIVGKVVTKKGIPLSGIRVYYTKDYSFAITDSNGTFEIETYRDGNATIQLYDANSYAYLNLLLSDNTPKNEMSVNDISLGEIKDLGNLVVEGDNFAPIIEEITIDPQTPIVGQKFYINVKAYDPDGDTPITYKLINYYSEEKVDSSTDGSIQISIDEKGYKYFTLKVSDGVQESTQRISIYVKDHAKPTIINVSNVISSWNQRDGDIKVSVNAYSSEGNALSYKFELENLDDQSVIPLLASENSTTLKSSDIKNGSYKLNIVVSDAYGKQEISRYFVADDSVAPVIETVEVNGTLNKVVSNGDTLRIKNGDTLRFTTTINEGVNTPTYRWNILSEQVNSQATENFTFGKEGRYYVSLLVRDKARRSDSRYFYVEVQANQAPVIQSVTLSPSIITRVGDAFYDGEQNVIETLTIDVDAFDVEGSDLSYTFANIDTETQSATVNPSDKTKATYTLNSNVGIAVHSIKVTVSDGKKTTEQYLSFEVKANQPPVVRSFFVPVNVKVGSSFNVSAVAQDPNGGDLTYAWSTSNDNVTITSSTNENQAIISAEKVGSTEISVVISDGVKSVTRTAVVTVKANSAPVIKVATITPSTIYEGGEIRLKVDASDIDSNDINIRWNLKNDTGSYLLSTEAQERVTLDENITAGTYTLGVTVTDAEGASSSEDFELIVTEANALPVISSFTASKTAVLVNEEVSLNVVAQDQNDVTITWFGDFVTQSSTSPDNATFKALSTGSYDVIVKVSNATESVTKTLTIDVSDIIVKVSANERSLKVGSDFIFTASLSNSDVVPTDVVWSVTQAPNNSSTSLISDGASATLRADASGIYTIQASVTKFDTEYINSITVSASIDGDADLEGIVKNSEGDILSGAQVRLYNKDDATLYDETITTDSSGNYSFFTVPAGKYYLVVYAGNGTITQTQVITISGAN